MQVFFSNSYLENDIGIKLCKCIRDEKDMDTRQKQKASELCDELDHLYTEIKIVPSSEQQNKLEGILKRAKTYVSVYFTSFITDLQL